MGEDAPGLSLPEGCNPIATDAQVDAPNPLLWRDQTHAVGQPFHDVHAEVCWLVFFIAVSQRNDSRAPTAAAGTTGKHADRMNELVVRVCFPMWRVTTAPNHNARTILAPSRFCFHRPRAGHAQADRGPHPLAGLYQPHGVAQAHLLPHGADP